MTCNGATKTMYLDGNVDAITSSWAANTGVGSQLWIGGSADTGDEDVALGGLIDEVYVFNRALSQGEVKNLMGNQSVDPVVTTYGQLPPASPVSLAPAGTLDLSGITQTLASLADGSGGGGVVTNSSGTSCVLVLSNATTTATTFSGAINDAAPAGTLGLTLAGKATQILAGTSLYAGPTGTGIFNGPVTVNGGTLAPGPNTFTTITFNSSLTFAAGATDVMKINRSLATNDQLNVSGALTYGGNLVVTNLGGTFVAGDAFKLFNAGSYAGAFTNISPASPGSGLAWNTGTLAVDGTLRVAAAAPPVIANFNSTSTNFILGLTGGPAGSPWRVLASPDLTIPLTNWTPVWTNVFDANGNGEFTNLIDPTAAQMFFDIVVP